MTTSLRNQLQATLGDAYTLERELGGGGMSRVFVASERSLARTVVIKVLAPELAAEVSGPRFTREIRLTANLQHPHIVPVLSAGETGGLPYYIMPFVEGESLRAHLARHGALPIPEAVSILGDIAKALEYAHAHGVVHRDIKPDNVLLVGRSATVADFGIAKALSASVTDAGHTLTQQGTALGTPAYMAPEQASGDPHVDHRADLYAFGAMAYEVLTGAPPFGGRPGHQQVVAHLTEQPAPLGERRPDIPPALAAIVRRCLEKDRDARPQSATEIVLALDGVSTPSHVSPRETAHPEPRRRMVAWGALGVVVVVVSAIAAWTATHRGGASGSSADAREVRSVAVLPFENVGGDTANSYFAEGMAEELTTALAQVPGLRLAGRRSALRFAGKGASAQDIGAALSVGAVLEGTVRRAGARIKVTAQLTSASDGLVLWTQAYEREVKDVFAMQDEIARAIAGALRVSVAGGAGAGNATQGTTDVQAYDLYLRAHYLYRRRTGLARALEYLDQAIARDSMFARAHAEKASVLAVMPYFLPTRPGEVLPRARASAEIAARLNPALADAHHALGVVFAESYQWRAAEAELRRAIALDSTNSEPQYRLGNVLALTGRVSEAIDQLQRAKARDPFYPLVASYLGFALSLTGRYDEAIAEGRRGLELEPAGQVQLSTLAYIYSTVGQRDSAAVFARRLAASATSARFLGSAAWILAHAGFRTEAETIARALLASPGGQQRRPSSLVFAYLALGDTTRALTEMERAAAGDGDQLFVIGPANANFDAVRASPRFGAVLKRYNFDVTRFTTPNGARAK